MITASTFPTATSYVSYAAAASINDMAGITVVSVFRLNETTGIDHILFHKGLAGSWSRGPGFGINVYPAGTPKLRFYANSTGTVGSPTAKSPTIAYNRWYQTAATWDGGLAATGIKMYLGDPFKQLLPVVTNSTSNGTTARASDAANALFVGNNTSGTGGYPFDGDIAYVALWSRVLTDQELQRVALYGPKAVNDAVLVFQNGRDESLWFRTDTRNGVYSNRVTIQQPLRTYIGPTITTEHVNIPGTRTVTYTGYAPDLPGQRQSITVTGVAGGITYTGQTPGIALVGGSRTYLVTFPRLGLYQIGNWAVTGRRDYGNPTFWAILARVDLLIISAYKYWTDTSGNNHTLRQSVQGIKALNPDILIGNYGMVMETPFGGTVSAPSSSGLSGTQLERYNKVAAQNWWGRVTYPSGNLTSEWGGTACINITSDSIPDGNGDRYTDWYADYINNYCYSVIPEFDFMFIDNYFWKPRVDADWNQDGSTDSQNTASVQQKYRLGTQAFMNAFHALQPNLLLAGNADSDLSTTEFKNKLNIALYETPTAYDIANMRDSTQGWASMKGQYTGRITNTTYPNLVVFCARMNTAYNPATAAHKRFFLYSYASCLMDDGYYSFTDENYNNVWWDNEMAYSLGTALDKPSAAWTGMVWKREFQRGTALVNTSQSTTATVTLSGIVYVLWPRDGRIIHNQSTLVSPSRGTITYTGKRPTAYTFKTNTPASGSLTTTATTPTVHKTKDVLPLSGTLTHVCAVPDAALTALIQISSPQTANLAYLGNQPAQILWAPSIEVGSGSITYTGEQPIISILVVVPSGSLTYEMSGVWMEMPIYHVISIGNMNYIGSRPFIEASKTVAPTTATLTHACTAPAISLATRGHVSLTPQTGALTYTVETPIISAALRVYGKEGRIEYTGKTPTVQANHITILVSSGEITTVGGAPVIGLSYNAGIWQMTDAATGTFTEIVKRPALD